MGGELRVTGGGAGGPLLLLLHGLGATGDVWAGVGSRWPGRWLAPDLPGHGGSPALPGRGGSAAYTFEALAEAVRPLVEADGGTVVLGHSLGGVVALALAARSPVAAVVGLGIKVDWSDDELARARALAERPVTWFATREEAVARHLKVSGLGGLLGPDDPAVLAGVRQEGGRWRLALDPAAFAVGAPDMAALVAGASATLFRRAPEPVTPARHGPAPVTLARGEHDPMNTDEQLARFGAPVVTLAGLGHNAHVADPARCLTLLA